MSLITDHAVRAVVAGLREGGRDDLTTACQGDTDPRAGYWHGPACDGIPCRVVGALAAADLLAYIGDPVPDLTDLDDLACRVLILRAVGEVPGSTAGRIVAALHTRRVLVVDAVDRLRAGSLPAMPREVIEALTWFGNNNQVVETFERNPFEMYRHMAAVVRWAMSLSSGHSDTGESAAPEQGDPFRHVGVGDPDPTDSDDECPSVLAETGHFCTRDCGHPGQHVAGDGETVVAVWPADPSPRSWSLPAPPPDDVTVEYRVRHLRSQQSVESPDAADLPEMKRMYRVALAQGEAVAESRTVSPWRELPVVEGEPQAAEPPRFAVGDRVRVRQSGKVGTVTGYQGAFAHVHLDDHPDIKFMSYDADNLEPASEPERWRTGRKVGRTLYRQVGEHPSDADPLIGVMDTPELAARVVAALAAVGAAREEKEQA